jgi:hypothetical protein
LARSDVLIHFRRTEETGYKPEELSVWRSRTGKIRIVREMLGPRGGVHARESINLSAAEWREIAEAVAAQPRKQPQEGA